ncbi:hypothetical protein ACFVU2_21130 [Leifsonia sp. NPDC058194]|uniref:hypothetical protein n=1 Tax=Leifsonia sp. NPDC058194 TaxID=3346374 RepID=UPI0036DE8AC4
MTMPAAFTKPANPRLAKVFDEAIARGHQIRYADETQVAVFQRNELGCMGLILLIIIGLLTAFIVPIILLVIGALSPRGRVITYTVKPNGKIKKKSRAARQ